jgi:hypothetical protein
MMNDEGLHVCIVILKVFTSAWQQSAALSTDCSSTELQKNHGDSCQTYSIPGLHLVMWVYEHVFYSRYSFQWLHVVITCY